MQEAINYYQAALKLFPEHYEAWLNLGNIYVAYEDYYSATQAYENAIMAKDNYTIARMNLGIITAEKLKVSRRKIIACSPRFVYYQVVIIANGIEQCFYGFLLVFYPI